MITSEKFLDHLTEQTKLGKTCLVSSHDLDMLEKYCNKVLYIDEGEIAFFGSLDSFLHQYNNFNEYSIVYDGDLTNKVRDNISDLVNVLEWQPLTVEIKNDESVNLILKVLVDHNIIIRSVEQKKHSLKEIIKLKG